MGVLPVKRLIVTMSLPMMVSMLVQALYNIVDSIFVSQINEQALTAVTLAFPLQSMMIAVSSGTGVGINAILSKSLGEKRFDR
ncbi:MAG: MATE family efflux transporter, partial [Lachnospiraceae bacterium]|nr:MATE family efflux transporter [Lachnospiraceae bacterium]